MIAGELDKRVIAACMGAMSKIHEELHSLDIPELDPALCSIEDAYTTLVEVLTGEPSAQALARLL